MRAHKHAFIVSFTGKRILKWKCLYCRRQIHLLRQDYRDIMQGKVLVRFIGQGGVLELVDLD